MEFNVASCGSNWDYTLGNENISAHPGTFRLVLDVVYLVRVDLSAKFLVHGFSYHSLRHSPVNGFWSQLPFV